MFKGVLFENAQLQIRGYISFVDGYPIKSYVFVYLTPYSGTIKSEFVPNEPTFYTSYMFHVISYLQFINTLSKQFWNQGTQCFKCHWNYIVSWNIVELFQNHLSVNSLIHRNVKCTISWFWYSWYCHIESNPCV